jgi:CheY-like chemotaxis protein
VNYRADNHKLEEVMPLNDFRWSKNYRFMLNNFSSIISSQMGMNSYILFSLEMLMLSRESPKLRVLIVDDHELTRLSLQLVFSSQENIHVVGLSSNGQEAIEMVKSHQPDVIILDLQMPIMDGWSASHYIKTISPTTQILAYSSVDESSFRQNKPKYNFDKVCKKDISTTELIDVVIQLGQKRGYSLFPEEKSIPDTKANLGIKNLEIVKPEKIS